MPSYSKLSQDKSPKPGLVFQIQCESLAELLAVQLDQLSGKRAYNEKLWIDEKNLCIYLNQALGERIFKNNNLPAPTKQPEPISPGHSNGRFILFLCRSTTGIQPEKRIHTFSNEKVVPDSKSNKNKGSALTKSAI